MKQIRNAPLEHNISQLEIGGGSNEFVLLSLKQQSINLTKYKKNTVPVD